MMLYITSDVFQVGEFWGIALLTGKGDVMCEDVMVNKEVLLFKIEKVSSIYIIRVTFEYCFIHIKGC